MTRLIKILTTIDLIDTVKPMLNWIFIALVYIIYNINIYIIICGSLIYKILSITCSKLFKGTYINYNAIKNLKGIVFCSNIYK